MKTLYFIKTPSGEKIGPYRSKNEADSQLYAHEGACTAEYYQLDKREQRIRNINPKLHSFATIFTIAGMLVPLFLPFNLIKGTLNAAITMLLYKPIVQTLRKANLIPSGSGNAKAQKNRNKLSILIGVVSFFVVVTCILLILVLAGKI